MHPLQGFILYTIGVLESRIRASNWGLYTIYYILYHITYYMPDHTIYHGFVFWILPGVWGSMGHRAQRRVSASKNPEACGRTPAKPPCKPSTTIDYQNP